MPLPPPCLRPRALKVAMSGGKTGAVRGAAALAEVAVVIVVAAVVIVAVAAVAITTVVNRSLACEVAAAART